MYALNLAEDGRVLSATHARFAPADAVIVDALPEGDLYEYRCADGQFVHDPLPVVEPVPVVSDTERITALEERLSEYEAAYAEGVQEA